MLLGFLQGVFQVFDFVVEDAIFKVLFLFVISFLADSKGNVAKLFVDVDKKLFDVVYDGLEGLANLLFELTDHPLAGDLILMDECGIFQLSRYR